MAVQSTDNIEAVIKHIPLPALFHGKVCSGYQRYFTFVISNVQHYFFFKKQKKQYPDPVQLPFFNSNIHCCEIDTLLLICFVMSAIRPA